MKIYIIGSPASGKTTLSKKLSEKYHIKRYELDCIVYDDEHEHVKRTDEEINRLFNKILKEKSWIIEDVGRSKFEKGRVECDKIYYLKFSKQEIYKRIFKRWLKQKMGKEQYNYPPTLSQLLNMIKIANQYSKKESSKLKSLEKYIDKITYIDNKTNINKL